MSRRTPLLALAALLAGVLLAAPAAADRLIADDAPSAAYSNDADTIARIAAPGSLELLDGDGAVTDTVDVGADCTALDAVGGGVALYECADGPRLLDLSTHATRVPVGAREALAQALGQTLGFARFEGVGTTGLLFSSICYHCGESVRAIDWRTGATVGTPSEPTQLLDLDSTSLVTTLCSPLRQSPWDLPQRGIDPWPEFDPFLYASPYGLTWGPRSPPTLETCGTEHALALDARPRHVRFLADVQLTRSVASWVVVRRADLPASLRVYRPSCGVRFERSVAFAQPGEAYGHVALASDALFVSEPLEGHRWRIRQLSLDGLCERAVRAWTLRVANGRRHLALVARPQARVRLRDRGWLATRIAVPGSTPRLAVRPGTPLRVAGAEPLRSLRWRIGGGAWTRGAPGAGIALGRFDRDARLRIQVRYASGRSARFALKLQPLR